MKRPIECINCGTPVEITLRIEHINTILRQNELILKMNSALLDKIVPKITSVKKSK